MNNDIVPLAMSDATPDAKVALESLVIPHAPGAENIGGVYPAPEPETESGASVIAAPVDSDAAKLERAKPGRKKQLVSKHRSKSELLAASRQLDSENAELRARVAALEGVPAGDGMSSADVSKSVNSALDATIELGSNVAAAYYGAHWVIPADERTVLRDAWAPILRMYAPRLGTALPWIGAISTTVMVLLPRINQTRELQAARRAAPVTAPTAVPETPNDAGGITEAPRYTGQSPV